MRIFILCLIAVSFLYGCKGSQSVNKNEFILTYKAFHYYSAYGGDSINYVGSDSIAIAFTDSLYAIMPYASGGFSKVVYNINDSSFLMHYPKRNKIYSGTIDELATRFFFHLNSQVFDDDEESIKSAFQNHDSVKNIHGYKCYRYSNVITGSGSSNTIAYSIWVTNELETPVGYNFLNDSYTFGGKVFLLTFRDRFLPGKTILAAQIEAGNNITKIETNISYNGVKEFLLLPDTAQVRPVYELYIGKNLKP